MSEPIEFDTDNSVIPDAPEDAATPWVTNRSRIPLVPTEKVTIGDRDYTVDKDDVFVRIGDEHPSLRPDIVAMFDRAGDSLATMRYPKRIAELQVVDDTVVEFIRGILGEMPAENTQQHEALDRAVARVIERTDDKVARIERLADETVMTM